MKFREYGEVTPKTLTAETPQLLDQKIEQVGKAFDIIDLQFSTTGHNTLNMVQFSALLLIRERKPVSKAKGVMKCTR